MGKPFSIDTRDRVVKAIERKGLSRRQAAERHLCTLRAAH
jgi:transposase